jgi:energy-coupling factor transporter ATP-binding protein EcfA2
MADQNLRRQYEGLVKSIEDKANAALTALGRAAGLKRGVQDEIARTYGLDGDDVYSLLDRLQSNLKDDADPSLGNIGYAEIFNDKVLQFLSKESTSQQLADYVDRYNKLIDNSTYFRRGVFNHNHAATVRRALADNGFFAAKHTLSLAARDAQKKEIATPEELDAAIDEEKNQILSDKQLVSRFNAIDKEITRNVELRQFRSYLESHPELIPELTDLDALRRKLWLSYSVAVKVELADFASTYRAAKEDIALVVKTARQQETQWGKVLSIFHRRFSVPFILEVVNQDDVILKDEAPSLIFKYKDGDDVCEIGRSELLNALSTGERRALYLLNVIFEIEARATEAGTTILVLDDIADSFDYKNKYAIVEYLKAILDERKFVMLILTHNFDFFRTVRSRLSIRRKQNCFMAIKSNNSVVLTPAEYLDPFQHWRKNLHRDRKLMVASIPMVRNLVEYKEGKDAPDFVFLTSVLHRKPESDGITMSHLAEVVNRVLATSATGGTENVIDVILGEAELCTTNGHTVNLENKVILSIAIRLLAEGVMISKINDVAKTDHITSNQTRILFDIYRQEFPGDLEVIAILERVMLMTPETIHLNSFMYEPILDMADDHLRSLHDDLKSFSILPELQEGPASRTA